MFELNDEQLEWATGKFSRIFEEIDSEYEFKYDILRALSQELIHFGMKLQHSANVNTSHINGSQRISALFLELLERQFPIDEMHHIQLRTASDFAK